MRPPLIALALGGANALVVTVSPSSAQSLFADQGTAVFEEREDWTNYLRVDDLDGDGDLDVIFANCGGFFSTPPAAQPLLVYENDGNGGLSNASASVFGDLTMPVRQIALGDIDGDGDLDLYVPHAGGQSDVLFVNQGGGQLVDESAQRLPAGASSRAGAARMGDVDGDGDLDILVADGYGVGKASVHAHLYLNDGAGMFVDATSQVPTTTPGYDPDDFDLLDLDRDFDLDLLINVHAGKSVLWINDGNGVFSDESERLPNMPGGASQFDSPYHYGPAVCDVDGDGDLDIWVDNVAADYGEMLLINDGAGQFSDETSRVMSNPSSDDNGLACVDVDDDGDLDAVVMSLSSNSGERVLQNDGSGHFNYVSALFPDIGDSTLWFDFGDIDGDGRVDAVTGQGEFGERRNRLYSGSASQSVDTTAPKVIVQEAPPTSVGEGQGLVLRYAVSDRTVTDGGPRLTRAFAKLSHDGMVVEAEARFIGGDIFRVVLPAVGTTGSSVAVELCATDRQGNTGCGAVQGYSVGVQGAGGGGVGGAASGSGGSSVVGGSTAAGGEDGSPSAEEGGCGCRLPQSSLPKSMWPAAWVAALAMFWRRRGRGSRR